MKVIKINGKYEVFMKWNNRGRLVIYDIRKIDDSQFADINEELTEINGYRIVIGKYTNRLTDEDKQYVLRMVKRHREALLDVNDFIHDFRDEITNHIEINGD